MITMPWRSFCIIMMCMIITPTSCVRWERPTAFTCIYKTTCYSIALQMPYTYNRVLHSSFIIIIIIIIFHHHHHHHHHHQSLSLLFSLLFIGHNTILPPPYGSHNTVDTHYDIESAPRLSTVWWCGSTLPHYHEFMTHRGRVNRIQFHC